MKNHISFILIFCAFIAMAQVKLYEMPDDMVLPQNVFQAIEPQVIEQGAKIVIYDSIVQYDTVLYKVGIKPSMGNRANPYQRFIDQKGEVFPEELFGLSDIDKPRFVNFWFTSCMPCIKEIPDLNALKEEFGEHVDFVAITFNTQEQVDKFLENRPIDFEHITNQQVALGKYGVRSYPMNMLLDKDGKILWVDGMLNYSKWEVEMEIKKLLPN